MSDGEKVNHAERLTVHNEEGKPVKQKATRASVIFRPAMRRLEYSRYCQVEFGEKGIGRRGTAIGVPQVGRAALSDRFRMDVEQIPRTHSPAI